MNFDFSPESILTSLFVGSIGYALFMYGKKSTRFPQLVTGLVLMIFPNFVSSVPWVLAISVLLLGALWASVRAGL